MLIALATKVPPAALDSWLRPCRLTAVEGDHIKIAAPNTYTRDWLHQHHTESLQAAAREVLGGNPRVSLDIDREVPSPAAAPNETEPPVAAPGLSARYTFDTFVVGNSNQFAQAACQAVAELPSRAYNPLFIYGGVGLGKTHLLHAVGHQIARLYPHLRLLYLSSERFTNELINAIRYDRTAEFRAKYRTIDLLLIDDIQFISGKERTQEEFFHTFNDLYEARKQIVLSSDARAQGDSRPRGAPPLPLRVGPDRRHPAARLRDAGRHPQEEGGDRARPAPGRRRLPHRQPHQVQHPRARGLAHPHDRLLLSLRPRHERGPRPGGARRPLGRGGARHHDRAHPAQGRRILRRQAHGPPRQEPHQGRRLPPPDRHVSLPPAHPRLARRHRPRLRRQGPHDRPPRGQQDPASSSRKTPSSSRPSTRSPRGLPCDPPSSPSPARPCPPSRPIAPSAGLSAPCASSTASTATTPTTTTTFAFSSSNNGD